MKSPGSRSKSLGKAAPDDDDGKAGRGAFDATPEGKRKEWYEKAEAALKAPG